MPFPPGTSPPTHLCVQDYPTWLSHTSFPPSDRSHGYPRRRDLQVLGTLAIPDVVTSRYWVPWLSQTSLPPGTGPPCYQRTPLPPGTGPPGYSGRRYLQVLGPLAFQTSLPPGTGSPGYPRGRYLKVLGHLAIQDVVTSRYWGPWLSQTT